MKTIQRRLRAGAARFDELFGGTPDREENRNPFHRALELLKLGKAHVRRTARSTPSYCIPGGGNALQPNDAAHAIEAILFVAGDAETVPELARALDLSELETLTAVEALQREYESAARGIALRRYGDHLRLETRAEYGPYVERMLQPVQKQSLSQAALETLAVIAYRQPATKGDVELVRGVKCDYSVQSLMRKGLIQEVGRKEALGRPILYATTDKFLEHFGITDIRELPPLPEPEEEEEEEEPLIP
jgi:segregation and condensation protein B